MNTGNQPHNDDKWQALLLRSTPTFAGESTPSFGFVTSTLARLKAEGERDILERIGLRALFASLAILIAVGGFSVGIQVQQRMDFDPGVRGLLQADDIPIS